MRAVSSILLKPFCAASLEFAFTSSDTFLVTFSAISETTLLMAEANSGSLLFVDSSTVGENLLTKGAGVTLTAGEKSLTTGEKLLTGGSTAGEGGVTLTGAGVSLNMLLTGAGVSLNILLTGGVSSTAGEGVGVTLNVLLTGAGVSLTTGENSSTAGVGVTSTEGSTAGEGVGVTLNVLLTGAGVSKEVWSPDEEDSGGNLNMGSTTGDG
jgi:hypothetical protein